MPASDLPSPDRGNLAPQWRRVFDWVEETTGGRIVGAEQQARWRPAWLLDVERGQAHVRDGRGARRLPRASTVFHCGT